MPGLCFAGVEMSGICFVLDISSHFLDTPALQNSARKGRDRSTDQGDFHSKLREIHQLRQKPGSGSLLAWLYFHDASPCQSMHRSLG